MKNIMDYCLGRNQKKDTFKHIALGAAIGSMVGIVAGMLIKDKNTCQKIKNSSIKLAKDASNAICEAKKIIIHKASNCCSKKPKKEIIELYTDDEC
ncbi:MAG: YtxH domain-containing protein [Clostridiales bacterium]|nr:YtxH domain-containing protein [Clostridiales bacterium]